MKKLYLLLCLFILVTACEKEELITEEVGKKSNSPLVESIKFIDLPQQIQANARNQILENFRSSSSFGTINEKLPVKKIKSRKGFSYTFSINTFFKETSTLKASDEYYFDNLVIGDNTNSTSLVIRYKPSVEWQMGSRDFSTFTGKIIFFSIEGQKLNEIDVSQGVQQFYQKEVCVYTLEKVETWCFGGEGSMTDEPYTCHKIYYYSESCTSGSTGSGGDPGGTGDGPGDPDSIPSEPIEGGSAGTPDPVIQDPNCQTTVEDVKKVFPNTSDVIINTITDLINIYGKDFGINTNGELQHFLAQAGHESNGFRSLEEDVAYIKVARLNEMWPHRFNPEESPTINPNKQNPLNYASNDGVFVNPELLCNNVYGSMSWLGNTSPGDGYKYRGRGIIQLTGRFNYTEFNNFYSANYDNSVNLVNNPDLLKSDFKIAVISALWFFKKNVLDKFTVTQQTSVEKITLIVNGGKKGLAHREQLFSSTILNVDCR